MPGGSHSILLLRLFKFHVRCLSKKLKAFRPIFYREISSLVLIQGGNAHNQFACMIIRGHLLHHLSFLSVSGEVSRSWTNRVVVESLTQTLEKHDDTLAVVSMANRSPVGQI